MNIITINNGKDQIQYSAWTEMGLVFARRMVRTSGIPREYTNDPTLFCNIDDLEQKQRCGAIYEHLLRKKREGSL